MRQRRWRALRQRGHLFSAKGAFSFFSLGQRPRDQCSIIQRALKARFRCGGENGSETVRGVFRSRATWERGAEMQIRILNSKRKAIRFDHFTLSVIRTLFETRSLPALTRCYPRSFTFYVARPIRSIRNSDFEIRNFPRPAPQTQVGLSLARRGRQ